MYIKNKTGLSYLKMKTAYQKRAQNYYKQTKMNKSIKFKHLTKTIDRYLPSDAIVLDMGCGEGTYTQYFEKNHKVKKIFAFDLFEDILELAKKRILNPTKVNFKQSNMENIALSDQEVNMVFCNTVVEHLLDDKKGLSELYRVLKPQGLLLISTDNKKNYPTKILSAPFYLLRWMNNILIKRKNTSVFYHRDYTLEDFQALIRSSGFNIIHYETFRISSPYLSKNILIQKLFLGVEWIIRAVFQLKNFGDIILIVAVKPK